MKNYSNMILSQSWEKDNETYVTNEGIVNIVRGYCIDINLCDGYLVKVYSNKEGRYYRVYNEFRDNVLEFKSHLTSKDLEKNINVEDNWEKVTTPLSSVRDDIKEFLKWCDIKLCELGF